MKYELDLGKDLGVEDCTYVAKGDTVGDIIGQVKSHLEEKHGMDIPEKQAIIQNKVDRPLYTEKIWLLIERLRERLKLADVDRPEEDLLDLPPGVPPPQRPI